MPVNKGLSAYLLVNFCDSSRVFHEFFPDSFTSWEPGVYGVNAYEVSAGLSKSGCKFLAVFFAEWKIFTTFAPRKAHYRRSKGHFVTRLLL
jgi:hypothetical protein